MILLNRMISLSTADSCKALYTSDSGRWLFTPVILAADCVSFRANPHSHSHPQHVQQAVYDLVHTTCILTGTGDVVLHAVIPTVVHINDVDLLASPLS